MIDIIKLENGISVVMEEMQSVRSTTFGIFIKTGAINEDENTHGISHFIEHMLFKGTKTRTSKQIAEAFDDIGGQLNAYTAKEHTCYYAKVLDTHINTAVDVLSDMLFNSNFDETEIQKECKVIIEEIDMYEDSPEDMLFSNLQKEIWNGSALSNSILGSKESVSSFTRNDFISYMDKHYTAENTVISIAGSFEKEKVISLLKEKFANMKKGECTENPSDKKYKYNPSKVKTFKDIEQLHLCIAFEGLSVNNEFNYTMSLINTVFGGGMSSILFQKVREENGLAYSIYSYNSNYINNGTFNIYMALNKTQLHKAIEIVKDEITKLRQNKISEEKISKTKEQLKSNYIMGLENTSNRMSGLGRGLILTNKVKTTDQIIRELDAITKKNADDVIDEVFNLDKMSISIVGRIDDINI